MKKSLIIRDRIYGEFTITSPVLIELLNSKPVQRLKGIAQFGVPDEFYHKKNYSRYEHSIGVMLLLKKLGASTDEQIAGLLHDVSHTAFSHIIDWVLGTGTKENYQDDVHDEFFNKSKLPAILIRHGYDPQKISDYHLFFLLEQPIPDLCADRIDYALRQFLPAEVSSCLTALKVDAGKIVFADENSAHLFARLFLKHQIEHWGGFESAARYYLFAEALKQAIKIKIISLDDFWADNDFVLRKLNHSSDRKICSILQTLRQKSLDHLAKSSRKVYKKFRYVDPEFIGIKGKILRLSDVNKRFRSGIKEAKINNEKGMPVPLVL